MSCPPVRPWKCTGGAAPRREDSGAARRQRMIASPSETAHKRSRNKARIVTVRLLHLAPASKERAIRRAGLSGRRARVADESGTVLVLSRAIFAMPVVPSFWTSHQWLRELRRWHDERMVAVHFRLPDDEPVHVGRFGEAHRLLPVAAAARWVMDHPDGAQVVVARSIARRDVVAVRATPQLVGWTGKPDGGGMGSCVCIVCLPVGSRDLTRRVRGAFRTAPGGKKAWTSSSSAVHAHASASASRLAASAPCERTTPLGSPVVPGV